MASQNTDVVDNTHTAFRDCELVSFRGEALPREAEKAQVPSKHGASIVALDIWPLENSLPVQATEITILWQGA